ncbi:hypothetical protein EJ110_NYTH22931 [Nymphaea thermarum]|nr:hypothetical protein EJ110_NYTH22931 [Nymphaea thermarum]
MVNLVLLLKAQDNCFGDFGSWHRHTSKAALILAKLQSNVVGEPLVVEQFYDVVDLIVSLLIGMAKAASQYGNWGICFTYGTWFGVGGLVAGSITYQSCSTICKACEFLLSKQLECGGWGESCLSC